MATLESGSVMLATAPAELAAAGRTSGNADMHLAGREGVSIRVIKVQYCNLVMHLSVQLVWILWFTYATVTQQLRNSYATVEQQLFS